ncbi:c-type cytochrome [Rhodoferax antarcticus]|uniref:c-type cytochrome n=1 Tax=Rhodoferax antarcticus TaxID=81479 RepID=UPI00222533F2|nr:cytochrome c [Rhodoferax antarcticus]MCW2313224.1 cytochrome c553 [Rhodoferax antarcticus]
MDMIGLYPTWLETTVGSGWIVGLIATIHVLFSHTSVGAAIFFAFLANYAHRNKRPDLLEFIRRYGLFLLVFSYVLGSITGPGIWYSTTVASPRGISALIHSFVWMWATEWVFFVIEVVGVYMLVYLASKVDGKTYLKLSIIFGLTSYTTMLVIVGILSFMMWPGKQDWYEQGGVLSAFYGPNTFAQLGMRTAFMFTMTAVVGGVVAARFKDPQFKKDVAGKLAWLGIGSTAMGVAMFQWYLSTLPETALLVLENRLPDWFRPGVISILVGVGAYFAMTLLRPKTLVVGGAWAMTVAVLVFGLWPEEVTRESIRKPWVAGQYLYSNQVIGRDVPGMGIKSEIPNIEAHGFMKTMVFMPDKLRTISDSNRLEAGRVLALATCSNCHSLTNTGMRPLKNYFTASSTTLEIAEYLQAALSSGNTLYMPQIPLKDDEAMALATYISSLNGVQPLQTALTAPAVLPTTVAKE